MSNVLKNNEKVVELCYFGYHEVQKSEKCLIEDQAILGMFKLNLMISSVPADGLVGVFTGHVTLVAIIGTTILVHILQSDQCNSFEIRVAVD